MNIAVCLFAYQRPKYLKKALETHKKIPGLSYYAFIDKSDIQKEIIDIIERAGIYDVIIKRYQRYGLNRNIRSGVDFAFEMGKDAVIVLEDDLLIADDGIEWLKENLERHHTVSLQEATKEYPFRCWGWGMKKEIWYQLDWELLPKRKDRDSWDVIVNENFLQNRWQSLGPVNPKVEHIGWTGEHYKQSDRISIRRIWKSLVNYFG